jgi:hypothetical protein
MNPSSFIKDIGRSFFVSCFLPAVFFISLGLLLLQDFLPKTIIKRIISSPYLFGGDWLISVIIIVWLSFALYSILPWTLNLYEGNLFPKFVQKRMISSLRKHWYIPKSPNIQKIINLKNQLEKSLSDCERQDCAKEFGCCRQAAINEYLNLEPYCPIEPNEPEFLLPTRLGNLLRSCMYYPMKRYNMNGDLLWPRLVNILPRDFLDAKDDNESRLIFMLNSSLLAYALSTFSLIGGLVGTPCLASNTTQYCSNVYIVQAFNTISPIGFILIGVLFGFLGYFFYTLAVSAGQNFSLSVRAGFDLYRFDLLRSLNLEIPKSIEEEKATWTVINELIRAGDDLGLKPLEIFYQEPSK